MTFCDVVPVNDGSSAVYSITGIPDNILIDPEGIIVARGLRGDSLQAKLAEIFK